MSNKPTLLIDGRNTAYRAIHAGRGNTEFTSNEYHPFVIWIRFARTWIEKFKPSSVHVFWDTPKADLWRLKISPEYKQNRTAPVDESRDISAVLAALEATADDILPNLNVRCYRREGQEADDLIYAACRLLTPHETIVISSDSDMLQLPWYMKHVTCYEPRLGKILDTPSCNPVHQKALAGDTADNIDGYRGIGEMKSAALLRDSKAFQEFLQVRGSQEYKKNLTLVDLSYNPFRMANELYVQKVMQSDLVFNPQIINSLIMKHKVKGLMNEYTRSIALFRQLTQEV